MKNKIKASITFKDKKSEDRLLKDKKFMSAVSKMIKIVSEQQKTK